MNTLTYICIRNAIAIFGSAACIFALSFTEYSPLWGFVCLIFTCYLDEKSSEKYIDKETDK